MSKMKHKRTLAFVCAMAMLVSSTACGSSDKKPEGNEEGVISDNFNATGLPILKEKQTFKIAVEQMSPLKEAELKQCVIDTEAATNIHIEWVEIPKTAWPEKTNIMFSTNSLPDAIIGDVDVSKHYEQLEPLDQLIADYAPNVTKFLERRTDYVGALKAPNGKMHALPTGDESIHGLIDSQYWINTQWLENVGMEMPTTTEEYKAVLTAFRNEDPNGNGEKDEIPFTFQDVWGWANGLDNMFGPFGVLENSNHVFMDGDKVVFSAKEEGYLEALTWLHELYAEELMDPDAFTMSQDLYQSRSGGKDIIGSFAGWNQKETGVPTNDAGDLFQPLPVLKGPDGTQMVGVNNHTKSGGFVISDRCETPEALVRWYDYINSSLELSLEWGRGAEGVAWEIVDVDGVPTPKLLTFTPEKLKEVSYTSGPEYRLSESFSGQTPSLWELDYAKSVVYDEFHPFDWKLSAVNEALPYAASGLPSGTAEKENAERRVILMADIDTYLRKFIADSIINGIDADKWAEHQKTLGQLKVDEYLSLCQEYVDSLTA